MVSWTKLRFAIFVFSLVLIGSLQAAAEKNCHFLELLSKKLPQILDDCPAFEGKFAQVQFLEDGGPSFINSVYRIILKDGKELIIKIGNPVWKGHKTKNEVAALRFLDKNSTIPVPVVITFESDIKHSLIGNEYIIMQRMAGKPLSKEIDRIYSDKELYHRILDQLAEYLSQMKSHRFSQIGNFVFDEGILTIAGIVDFAEYDVKTPCQSYSEYGWHALNFYVKEMEKLLEKGGPDAELYKKYIPILKSLLGTVDFRFLDGPDKFVFSHQDFVMKNILVDGDKVTAILDWEWSGSALLENEAMTGLDFLFSDEDRLYFERRLTHLGIPHFFDPPPSQRQMFYRLLGNVYTLVAFREWQEGKLEHTAKFLSQKLEQRKIRNNPNYDMESFISNVVEDLDDCISILQGYSKSR